MPFMKRKEKGEVMSDKPNRRERKAVKAIARAIKRVSKLKECEDLVVASNLMGEGKATTRSITNIEALVYILNSTLNINRTWVTPDKLKMPVATKPKSKKASAAQ